MGKHGQLTINGPFSLCETTRGQVAQFFAAGRRWRAQLLMPKLSASWRPEHRSLMVWHGPYCIENGHLGSIPWYTPFSDAPIFHFTESKSGLVKSEQNSAQVCSRFLRVFRTMIEIFFFGSIWLKVYSKDTKSLQGADNELVSWCAAGEAAVCTGPGVGLKTGWNEGVGGSWT